MGKLITLLEVVLSQVMIGFLLNNNQAPIGSSVISTCSPADLSGTKGKECAHSFQQTLVGEEDCVTSPKSVCVGGYMFGGVQELIAGVSALPSAPYFSHPPPPPSFFPFAY